jgi:hypothetical protein
MCINVFFFDYGGGVGVKYIPSRPSAEKAQDHKANTLIQIPRLSLHERSPHGIHSAGLSPALDHTRLQPDAVLDRSLWALPRLSPPSPPHLLARPPGTDHLPRRRRRQRHGSHRLRRRRVEGSRDGSGPWRRIDWVGNGRVLVVVDWVAKIQE